MKTVLAITAFSLTLGLSSLANAAFQDKSPTPHVGAATTAARQDLSHLPTVTGFNQKSHHAKMAKPASSTGQPMVLGANCNLSPQIGFNEKSSLPTC